MANKSVLFLVIVWSVGTSSSDFDESEFTTPFIKQTSVQSYQTCYLNQEDLDSRKISATPTKIRYHQMDKISYSCQPGLYLQEPVLGSLIIFENICINGTWKTTPNSMPTCGNGCLEWNYKLNRWQAIYLNTSDIESGFITSPGYPGNIRNSDVNCTYTIEAENGFIKLVGVSLSIQEFQLEIISDGNVNVWPNNSSMNDSYHLTGFGKITVRIIKSISPGNVGKSEIFKLLFRKIESNCHTYPNDAILIINKTKISNFKTVESYSCPYPYLLIGPDERSCIRDIWNTLMMPRCKFTCDDVTEITIDKVMELRISIEKPSGCKLFLINQDVNDIIEMKIKRISIDSTHTNCLYIEFGNYKSECWKNDDKEYFFVSQTHLTISKNEISEPEILQLDIKSVPTRYCSPPHAVRNGITKFANATLNSVSKISCNKRFYLIGSSEMRCTLDPFGVTHWNWKKTPECVKLCRDQWQTIEISKSPFPIKNPPFVSLDFSENQFCKWKIKSIHFPPIVSITSTNNIKRFINITVSIGSTNGYQKDVMMDTIFTNKNVTKMIFFCPLQSCNLTITPLDSLIRQPRKFFLEVKLKLADNVESIEYHPVMFFFIMVMVILCFMLFFVFYDYSRHPYTGYTAKFLNLFKTSKLKRISAFSIFDKNVSKPISKTEADINVFYNKYHSDISFVKIQRSVSCVQMNKKDVKSWKYRFSTMKRRFSDITDMVFINCSIKSGNGPTENDQECAGKESVNNSYQCDEQEFI